MSHHTPCVRALRRHPVGLGDIPRGGVDPILHPVTALKLFEMALSKPVRWETIVVPVDACFIGHALIHVDHTGPDASMTRIVDLFAQGLGAVAAGLLVATSRPFGGSDRADVAEWFAASDAAARHGCELIEWFVIGTKDAWLPRVSAGAPSRWPQG